ncbi:oxygenase MpaB family protein, partial [Mycolicibacter arupensis]|uniref:oxygenase MpaB family protein n=1 Tax=Mycolicibacter arupensis TaxID=342002 RepID=UPI003B3AD840
MSVTPTASVEQASQSAEESAPSAAPAAPKPAPAVEPLNSESLTWKYFGDLRTGIMGVWIGAIENMYPGLGAGVTEHSSILSEPMQRVTRSVYPIMGVVYDGARAQHTGSSIRDYHRDIKGTDEQGRRYHALDPDTFYWAHATFFMLIIKLAEYFDGGLTLAEKRQLFDEHVQWYRMYGM